MNFIYMIIIAVEFFLVMLVGMLSVLYGVDVIYTQESYNVLGNTLCITGGSLLILGGLCGLLGLFFVWRRWL
jgi:hypothetical protein